MMANHSPGTMLCVVSNDFIFLHRDIAPYGAMINGDGEVTDFVKLAFLLCRKNSWKETEREGKAEDMSRLKRFISKKKPHVIVVGATSRDALSIQVGF